MNLFAFYAVRGYKLQEFASLDETEKLFLRCAQDNYYGEEFDRMKYAINAAFAKGG